MTFTQINLNSAEYRLAHCALQQTAAKRIAWLRDYLRTNAHLSWTEGYRQRETELAALETQGRTL